MTSKARRSGSSSAPAPAAASILYARLVAQFLGKHLPGEPTIVPQNMPGASSVGRRQLCLQHCQAGRLDLGRAARRSIFRSDSGPRHGEVRLGQIHLDWLARKARSAALYARGQSLQDARRYSARGGSRRGAAARERARRAISCRKFWRRLSVSSSKRLPAIKAAVRSTSRSSAASCIAAPTTSAALSVASRREPGSRMVS